MEYGGKKWHAVLKSICVLPIKMSLDPSQAAELHMGKFTLLINKLKSINDS